MPTIHKWMAPGSVETVLSTELDSLADEGTAVSGVIDNSAGLYKFADFEIYDIRGSNDLGTYHSLYLLESLDGTNHEDPDQVTYAFGGVAGFGSVAQLIGNIICIAGTAPHRKVLRLVPIPPCKFKVVFINGIGRSMQSSGNTVKMIRYAEQDYA